MNRCISLCRTVLIFALTSSAFAEPIAVHYPQGIVHGFLTIRSGAGAMLGYAEFTQTVSGDHVTARTILHFRDGSLDDETAVFTQRRVFSFVSDHHIQRGPFFKNAIDARVESSGQVSTITTGEDGKVKQESSHIDLPSDVSNGMVGPLVMNLPHATTGVTVGMVLPIGKGRLIKLKVTPNGAASFSAVQGATRTASLFRIRLDLGGVAGVVAPMVGKQPADVILWVLQGAAPVIVREDAQLFEGGPIVSLELAGTSFPRR